MKTLLDAISSGKIRINEELPPERELAENLGIGRGSLRESLAVLEFLGVIESRGNRKVVIKGAEYFEKAISMIRISDQDDIMFDFIEFRRMLESTIVRLACERGLGEDIRRIEAAVEKQRMDPEDVAIDHEFHMGLAEASHNAFMVAVEDFVVSMLADIRARGLAVEGRAAKIVEEHDGILQAVRGRDKALAKERICAHLDNIEMIVRMDPQTNRKHGRE